MDSMEWEDTKENFVPVKQGHSAALLTTPLPSTKRNQDVEETKRSYLEDIKAADDPLAAWQRYIKWTQEQFATQGSKTELQQVLEAATKSLSTTSRYNNDVRLLRIWVQYADCLPDPSDVFLYLESNGIGRDHALLYEAYATYLELKGNFKRAGLVYQEGINRLAKPLERLKLKHTAFQQRMEKRIQRQTSEALLGIEAAPDSSTARSTLAPVLGPPQVDENGSLIRSSRQQSRQHSTRVPPQAGSVAAGIRPASNSSTRPSMFGGSMPTSTATGLFGLGYTSNGSSHSISSGAGPLASQQGTNNAAKPFAIMVDDEFGPSGSGVQATAFPASQHQHSQLPAYKTSRKENTTEAAEWAGQKVKQQAVYTVPAASKLPVYEDDDCYEEAAQTNQQSKPQQAGFRQRLELPGPEQSSHSQDGYKQSSLLAAGPAGLLAAVQQQKLSEHAAASATAAPASSSVKDSMAVKASNVSSKAQPAGAMKAIPQGYNPALLVDSVGSEVSFEEVRARAWRQKQAQQSKQHRQQPAELKQTQQTVRRQQLTEPSSQLAVTSHTRDEPYRRTLTQVSQQPTAISTSAVALGIQDLQSKLTVLTSRQQQQAQMEAQKPVSGQQQLLQQGSASAADPTVTVNTRAALESLNFMFSQDLPTMTLSKNSISSAAAAAQTYAAAGARGFRAPGGPAAESTVTINTRAAFDAMNGIFGCEDDTTTMHPFSVKGRSTVPEPTITINTRNAFDCMNDMFGDMTGQQTFTGRPMVHGRATQKGSSTRQLTGASSAGGWQLHEDTELLQGTRGLMNNRQGHDSWEVREDTEFVGATSRLGADGPGAGLGVCEDTEFITRPMGNAAAGHSGFTVYEDTDYLNVPVAQASIGMDRLSLANRASGLANSRARQGVGIELHEDTELLTRPTSIPPASNSDGSRTASTSRQPSCAVPGSSRIQENTAEARPNLGLHEDTELLTCNTAAAGARMGLGLHEDTDLLPSHTASRGLSSGLTAAMSHSSQQRVSHSRGFALGVQEDTELSTNHVASREQSDHVTYSNRAPHHDECSDTTTGLLRMKENLPAAVVPRGHRAPLGLSATATTAGPHGSSRLGHSSAPGSPALGKPPLGSSTPARHPVSAHATPSRVPSTPGTPWARPCEDFEVMESPAVRQAMAGQHAIHMSPAAAAPSPGVGSFENLPFDENSGLQLKPRSMRDREARAAALQPLSKSRADLLGVLIEPADQVTELDEFGRETPTAAPGGEAAAGLGSAAVSNKRPNALRSLRFQA